MRMPRKLGLVVPPLVCGAVVLGTAAPAVSVTPGDPVAPPRAAAPAAPDPSGNEDSRGTAQGGLLGALGDVLGLVGGVIRGEDKEEEKGQDSARDERPAYNDPYGRPPMYGNPAYGEPRPAYGEPVYGERPAYDTGLTYGEQPAYGSGRPYGGGLSTAEAKAKADELSKELAAYPDRQPGSAAPLAKSKAGPAGPRAPQEPPAPTPADLRSHIDALSRALDTGERSDVLGAAHSTLLATTDLARYIVQTSATNRPQDMSRSGPAR